MLKENIIKPTLTANRLTKEALRIFDMCGYEVWRQNNAAVYDEKKQVFRKNSAKRGVSDIIGYHRKTGVFIAVEIKVGKDKLSHEQTLFLRGIIRSGGVGLVIKRYEDLEYFLQIHNGFKKNNAKIK